MEKIDSIESAEGDEREVRVGAWIDWVEDRLVFLSRRLAMVAVASVLIIAFSNVLDILLRNFTSTSLYGLNEINALLVSIGAATCIPYGLASGSSLNIDMLSGRVSKRAQLWFMAAGSAASVAFFGLLAWRIWVLAGMQAHSGQTTIMTNLPIAPFFRGMAVAIGFAAFLQAVACLRQVRDALVLAGEPWRIAIALVTAAVPLYIVLAILGHLPFFATQSIATSDPIALAGMAALALWLLIMVTVPIGAAMGLCGVVATAIVLGSEGALQVLGSESTSFITSDAMSVLPLFLLMGAFASVAGVGSDLYRLADALLGQFRGGLAYASIAACAGFGTMTGSSVATQMSIGRIALSEMRARNYSPEIASGTIAAGGTLGQLLPPSSALILYGVMAEQSIGQLFIGAIIPGLLAALLYMATVTVWLIIYPDHAAAGRPTSFAAIASAVRGAWSVLVLLFLVLGGIYFGIFTDLEAGSVGAAGAFLIALARGRLNPATFWNTMAESTGNLAMMYSLTFGVVVLSFFFGVSGVPDAFIDFLNSTGLSAFGMMLAMIACYLVLGTVMDAFAMMVITIPIFAPAIAALGYDPIWWGLITIICMEAGQISPPFGINIFVISALDPSIKLRTVFRGCWPFFFSTIVKIVLLIAFPSLVTWLPGTR